MKAGTLLKVLWNLFLLVGVGLYLYGLYAASGDWSARLAEPPEVRVTGPTSFRLHVVMEVFNPSGYKVFAKSVWLIFYAEDRYLGETFIPYLMLEPGANKLRLSIDLDVRDLPCAAALAWSRGDPLNITVSGWATVTIYAFGLIPVRDVTVPFETNAYSVDPPQEEGLDRALDAVATLCKALEAARGATATIQQGITTGATGGPTGAEAEEEEEWPRIPVVNATIPIPAPRG